MRNFLVAMAILLTTSGIASAQLPAQKGRVGTGERPTKVPSGKALAVESEKTKAVKLTPKDGGNAKAYAAIAQVDYLIGIRGYPSDEGIVVMSTVQRRDLNQGGRSRCPVAEIEVDFQGNGRLIKVRLEPGDTVTAIDGFTVRTLDELTVAINSASDPHVLDISFIDWKTGNEYTGSINAMKIR